MTRVAVILLPDGKFDTLLVDSEVEVSVYKRTIDDKQIDVVEAELTEVELNHENTNETPE